MDPIIWSLADCKKQRALTNDDASPLRRGAPAVQPPKLELQPIERALRRRKCLERGLEELARKLCPPLARRLFIGSFIRLHRFGVFPPSATFPGIHHTRAEACVSPGRILSLSEGIEDVVCSRQFFCVVG